MSQYLIAEVKKFDALVLKSYKSSTMSRDKDGFAGRQSCVIRGCAQVLQQV